MQSVESVGKKECLGSNDKGFFIDSLLSLNKNQERSSIHPQNQSTNDNLADLFTFYKFLNTQDEEEISDDNFDGQNEQVIHYFK